LRPTPNRASFAHVYTHCHPPRLCLRNCCYSSKHTAYCRRLPDVRRRQSHSVLPQQRLDRRAEVPGRQDANSAPAAPPRLSARDAGTAAGSGSPTGTAPVLIDPPVVGPRPRPLHFQPPHTTGDPPRRNLAVAHPPPQALRVTLLACHFIVASDLLLQRAQQHPLRALPREIVLHVDTFSARSFDGSSTWVVSPATGLCRRRVGFTQRCIIPLYL